MKLYRQKLFSSLGEDVVCEFLGRLSGFIHRAKTLHWSAKGKDIHEYLDSFWKELYEFQDTVAEGWMGIEGKISDPFSIPCVPADELYPMDFIREVETRVLDFYNLLPADDPRYKGLSGETESFIQAVEKYKYLFSLCFESSEEREFSKKTEDLETATALGGLGLAGAGLVSARKFKKNTLELAGKYKNANKMAEAVVKAKKTEKALKAYKKGTRLQDRLNKVLNKAGEISAKDLAIKLDTNKHSREDIRKALDKFKKTPEGKVITSGRRTKALTLGALGLAGITEGLDIYNQRKSKKEK